MIAPAASDDVPSDRLYSGVLALNVVGGFWVTNRMLGMFQPPVPWVKKRKRQLLCRSQLFSTLPSWRWPPRLSSAATPPACRPGRPDPATRGCRHDDSSDNHAFRHRVFESLLDRHRGSHQSCSGRSRPQLSLRRRCLVMVAAHNGVGGGAAALIAPGVLPLAGRGEENIVAGDSGAASRSSPVR